MRYLGNGFTELADSRKKHNRTKSTREANASTVLVTKIATSTTIASNFVLIILTWVKTFGIYNTLSRLGMRTPLTTLLILDGTAYFLCDIYRSFTAPDCPLTFSPVFCS